MRYRLFLLVCTIISILTYQPAKAAFPVSHEIVQNAHTPKAVELPSLSFIKQYKAARTAKNLANKTGSGNYGVASIVSGIAGILTLILAFTMPVFVMGMVVLSILASVAAIVFGAMGFGRPNEGLAIGGFVIGILNLSIIVFLMVLLLIFLSALK